MKTVYSYNEKGQFAGETIAHESPLEPGIYHIPADATEIAPPALQDETKELIFKDGAWTEQEPARSEFTYADLDGNLVCTEVLIELSEADLAARGWQLANNETDFTNKKWNASNQEWEDDIAAAQATKITTLASNRSTLAESSTITYNDKTYANSQNARIAILNYILSLGDDDEVAYFTYPERKIVYLKKTDFEAMRKLIQEYESTLRKSEVEKINEINACSSVEELENININLE